MYLERSHVVKACNCVDHRVDKWFSALDSSSKLPPPGDVLWFMLEGVEAALYAIADNAEEVTQWFESIPMPVEILEKLKAYEELF